MKHLLTLTVPLLFALPFTPVFAQDSDDTLLEDLMRIEGESTSSVDRALILGRLLEGGKPAALGGLMVHLRSESLSVSIRIEVAAAILGDPKLQLFDDLLAVVSTAPESPFAGEVKRKF